MLGMMSTFRRRILFGAVAVFIVATVTTAGYFIIVRYGFPGSGEPSGREPKIEGSDVRHGELATFASCQAIADAFKDHREALAEATELPGVFMRADGIGGGGGDTGALDYTRTNTQVEGVDEADIVKTDGTFLYILTAQRALHVLQATPPDRAQRLLAKLTKSLGLSSPKRERCSGSPTRGWCDTKRVPKTMMVFSRRKNSCG